MVSYSDFIHVDNTASSYRPLPASMQIELKLGSLRAGPVYAPFSSEAGGGGSTEKVLTSHRLSGTDRCSGLTS